MNRGFTLLEIVIAIVLALMVITMAVPTLSGLLEGQKESAGFEAFNDLAQEARQRSIEERRPWVLEWQEGEVLLRPQEMREEEEVDTLTLPEGVVLTISFPAAMIEAPPPLWTFWPSGNCEEAIITWSGGNNGWTASYHPLTARPEVTYNGGKP